MADQTSLPLPPPAPAASVEPVSTPPVAVTDAALVPVGGVSSLRDTIARSIAAGEAATKADGAVPTDVPSADPVADIPEPPAQTAATEPVKVAETPDPMAAFAARFEAMEKQNAALLERLEKLTAQPAPAAQPEPEKPAAQPAERTLPDSPYEAQARVYFGDLPKPLLTQATEAFERRHGWQLELSAAESALQGGDAAARGRVQAAQTALSKVQTALERIDFDAQLAKQAQSKPQPVATPSWGVVARDEFVDAALSDRAQWKPAYQALEDHEVAAVLRAVPAGQTGEDYVSRAEKALDAYVAKRQATPAPAVPAAKSTPTQPKNPAPPAPAKPDVTVTGESWKNNELPSKHDKFQRIIAKVRGDAMTN